MRVDFLADEQSSRLSPVLTITNKGDQVVSLLGVRVVALNNRNIRIAKNNRRVADLVFKAQVITTVSAVIGLYWDLVSFNENVRVQRQAVALAQKLRHVFVATTDGKGLPHVAAAGKMALTAQGRVAVAAWFCPMTNS
jgi:hypothetical protein